MCSLFGFLVCGLWRGAGKNVKYVLDFLAFCANSVIDPAGEEAARNFLPAWLFAVAA